MIYANKGGEHVFGLLMTIIIGFLVGMIAKLIMPGKENMGFILTTLLGIAGSYRDVSRSGRGLVSGR